MKKLNAVIFLTHNLRQMKLTINYSQKTVTVKQTFNQEFPFLKIEFFDMPHKEGDPTSVQNMLAEDICFEKINPYVKEGVLTIKSTDTVAAVEKSFQQFGLSVQVFRKQKDAWIETTKTDGLTLMQQNEMGKQACAPPEYVPPGDRYLEDGQY